MGALELKGIGVNFGGIRALAGLSVTLEPGEILGLIGPNGAGKTTVFNLVTGVYRPTQGSITFGGRNLARHRPCDIARLGISRTFQNIRLFQDLSVLDNVRIARHRRAGYGLLEAALRLPARGKGEAKLTADCLALLDLLGLAANAQDRAGSLPYGRQRKLEIARALATEPQVLLLDEPAAGMNSLESADLVGLIRRIHSDWKLSIFLIEHHMDVVMEACGRIVVLDYGEPIAEGTPGEIRANPRVIQAYLGEEVA